MSVMEKLFRLFFKKEKRIKAPFGEDRPKNENVLCTECKYCRDWECRNPDNMAFRRTWTWSHKHGLPWQWFELVSDKKPYELNINNDCPNFEPKTNQETDD